MSSNDDDEPMDIEDEASISSEEESDDEEQAAAVEAAQASLKRLGDELDDAARETAEYEAAVKEELAAGKAQEILDRNARLPTLNGNVEKLQMQVDAVSGGAQIRPLRKELAEKGTAIAARITAVFHESKEQARSYAEARKTDGNTKFGEDKFEEAEAFYSEAIRMDPTPVYYCNRASCRMARSRWAEAAEDAEAAIKCDVNFPKTYLHLAKCRMQLGNVNEAANALLRAPNAVRRTPPMEDLTKTVALSVKDAGNAKLKAGAHSEAVALYTIGAQLEPKNPVFPSNRSACYQSMKRWREASSSARDAIRADKTFAKGYLHLAKSMIQMNSPLEARHSLEEGLTILKAEGKDIPPQMETMLQELLAKEASSSTGEAPPPQASSGAQRAEKLKADGNTAYKAGQYAAALKMYTAAISADPSSGAIYGNRAACWMMMRQYERAADDCGTGLKYDQAGELGKLRARQATALVNQGKVERAIDVLEEGVTKGGPHTATLKEQLKSLQDMMSQLKQGEDKLSSGEHRVAKQLFQKVLAVAGMENSAKTRLNLAKAHLALGGYAEAGSEAQKTLAIDPNMQEAYLVRADSLHFLGQTDKALQNLKAALQRDPDATMVSKRLKALRALHQQTQECQEAIKQAHLQRKYDEVVELATKGLQIDPDNKTVVAKMYLTRAKGYNNLAIKQRNGSGLTGEEREEEMKKAPGSWQRCLQDASKAIYYNDGTSAPYLLRAGALQALERWDEAVLEIQDCINKGPGRDDRSVHEKLQEAEFMLKKSQREDLYKMLAVPNPKTATEKEIQKAYKRKALSLHPDKQGGKSDEEKAKAEEEFKKCGEALEILTDSYSKQLWDEGHDLESIKQKVEMRKQRQAQGGGHGFF